MDTNAALLTAMVFTSIGALTSCAALSGPVQADDREITIKIHVSYTDLDLSQPAGAKELYHRLREAAKTVCGHGDRVDLTPLDDVAGCYENVIGAAVRSAKQPQLTSIYLKTHMPDGAATHGSEIPVPAG